MIVRPAAAHRRRNGIEGGAKPGALLIEVIEQLLRSWVHVLSVSLPTPALTVTLDRRVFRSLDAIHLAAAQALGDELTAVITYDQRMTAAAEDVGLTVRAPR
jgi:predicted nucleic acid-binding protein